MHDASSDCYHVCCKRCTKLAHRYLLSRLLLGTYSTQVSWGVLHSVLETVVFRPIELFLKCCCQNASIVATKLVEQDMTWDLLENQMRLEGATAVREVLTQIGLSVGTSLRLVTLLTRIKR